MPYSTGTPPAARSASGYSDASVSLFDDAPVAYHEIDREGRIVRVNTAERNLLGYSASEMIGHYVWEFVAAGQRELSQDSIRRNLGSGEPLFPVNREYVRRDGAAILVQVHENRIFGLDGATIGLRSMLVDITERWRIQEELEARARELARSNAELEQFAYVASHDLQEPLRMVASYTQLLAKRYKGKLGSDADEFIGYAVDGANRMQQLINDLLAYSRVGTRGGEFRMVNCAEVLARSLTNLRAAILESDALVDPGPLPIVCADPVQLGQLFQNLIGNAIKFRNGRRPEVRVSAEELDAEWQFSVGDNGIGIDPKHSKRIFAVFQRLHTREQYPGTGIGLAICKKIAERHGGHIWVESQPGQGAAFHFTIRKKGPESQ